jgi:hypothetical protein
MAAGVCTTKIPCRVKKKVEEQGGPPVAFARGAHRLLSGLTTDAIRNSDAIFNLDNVNAPLKSSMQVEKMTAERGG